MDIVTDTMSIYVTKSNHLIALNLATESHQYRALLSQSSSVVTMYSLL